LRVCCRSIPAQNDFVLERPSVGSHVVGSHVLAPVLVIVLAIAFASFLHLYRMNRRTAFLQMRLAERIEERTRRARVLLDALLQAIYASRMVAEDARERIGNLYMTDHAFERLAEWLERAAADGRAALEALQLPARDSGDLATALGRAAEGSVHASSLRITVSTSGVPRPLHPVAGDEIYDAGSAAVRWVCRLSQVTEISINVDYQRYLRVRIRAGGSHVDLRPERINYVGPLGLRERVVRAGGKLTISTSKYGGINVELAVPGKLVYRRPAGS
jgi:signal transduction histidine kinase